MLDKYKAYPDKSWFNPQNMTALIFPKVINRVPVLRVLPVWRDFAGQLKAELPDEVRQVKIIDRYRMTLCRIVRHADGTPAIIDGDKMPKSMTGCIVEIEFRE
jgi:hypothetical protein